MYQTPKLERFGTFRSLTLGGGIDNIDVFTTNSGDGCTDNGDGTATCKYSA